MRSGKKVKTLDPKKKKKKTLDPWMERREGMRGPLSFLLLCGHPTPGSTRLQDLKQATCLAYPAGLRGL